MVNWILRKWAYISNSIAFLPALVSLAFGVLSVVLILLNDNPADKWLEETFVFFKEGNTDTALAFVTTALSVLISLTVFSFSMVMVVLSQASSNFSPKILDGLLKEKRPQWIIGFYIGSIVFCVPLLFSLGKYTDAYQLASMALATLAILILIDIFLFISFIHFITNSVKPASICKKIYMKAKTELRHDQYSTEKNKIKLFPEAQILDGFNISHDAISSGYFQYVKMKSLVHLCKEHKITMEISVKQGDFVLEQTCLFKTKKVISEELSTQLHNCFIFYTLEDVANNPYYGFRQLSEIGVKALSPGINDVGTARLAINFLTELTSVFAHQPLIYSYGLENQKLVYITPYDLNCIFEEYFDPIRLYAAIDKNIMIELLASAQALQEIKNTKINIKASALRFEEKIWKDLKSDNKLNDIAYLEEKFRPKAQWTKE